MKINTLSLLIVLSFFSCENNDNNTMPEAESDPPNISGLNFTQSTNTFDSTYETLRNSIDTNMNIGIVAEVNHASNAESVNLELNATRIIFFGNPNLGTPLMQRNQLAGLDLPQKILVYQNDLNEIYAGFNSTAYLSARHGLEGVMTLPMIENALTGLSTTATGQGINIPSANLPSLEEGIVTKESTKTFDETYNSLRTAIDNNPNLTIVAEVNHQMNATNVNMDLNPTRLIIFGNPNLGTPLMQNAQTTALDLPQKMLVWQDDQDVVHVSYNDPEYLQGRHGITDNMETLNTVSMALDNLSNVAIE